MEHRMQPLELPQSVITSLPLPPLPTSHSHIHHGHASQVSQTQSVQTVNYQHGVHHQQETSPHNAYGWKSYDNHHSYSLTATASSSIHTTSKPQQQFYNQYTWQPHAPSTSYYPQSQLAVLANHSNHGSPPQTEQHPQQVMDPYTFSQVQYRLQLEQIALRHQQQQQQQQQHAHHQQQQQQQVTRQQHQRRQHQPVDPAQSKPASTAQASSNNNNGEVEEDLERTLLAKTRRNIEKRYLNANFVTKAVFDHLSTELAMMSAHESYDAFWVSVRQTGIDWDMVIRIAFRNDKDNKTEYKYYLAHQEYVLHGKRRSDLFIEESRKNGNCFYVKLDVDETLFNEFDHVMEYIYEHDIYLGDTHLVPLYVLFDRLKLNGGGLEDLYREIKRFCDKNRCVSYLLKSEEMSNEELIWLCSDSILQNLSFISHSEWLTIPLTAFHRLIFQAVSAGVGGKYSDVIVCELIIQYIKAIMSESHDNAKEIINHLETTDITSVSLDHCLPLVKICDILFCGMSQKWRFQKSTIYRLCIEKLGEELTPYHSTLLPQLQGLSPVTFASILVRAHHLKENALNLALMKYKDGNHFAYYKDRRLGISTILSRRANEMQANQDKHNDDNEKDVLFSTPSKYNECGLRGQDTQQNGNNNNNQQKLADQEYPKTDSNQFTFSHGDHDDDVDHEHHQMMSPLDAMDIIANYSTHNYSRSPQNRLFDDYSASPASTTVSPETWSPPTFDYEDDFGKIHDSPRAYVSPLKPSSTTNIQQYLSPNFESDQLVTKINGNGQ